MAGPREVRRSDKVMDEDLVRETISEAYSGRLGTVGPDGWPYVVPMLYVWMTGEVWLHNTRAPGHLRANVEHEPRVCFEVDEPGEVFPYGRFECDTSLAYRSVVAFGRIRIVDERDQKQAFCDALMEKYGDPGWARERGVYPRLDLITVYAVTIERMTGKQTPLPALADQWPAADHTKTPDA